MIPLEATIITAMADPITELIEAAKAGAVQLREMGQIRSLKTIDNPTLVRLCIAISTAVEARKQEEKRA